MSGERILGVIDLEHAGQITRLWPGAYYALELEGADRGQAREETRRLYEEIVHKGLRPEPFIVIVPKGSSMLQIAEEVVEEWRRRAAQS